MARPSQDPQKRINEILEASEPLFYSKGYHETSISDIVKKMGVAHGTIYYYFKSKEEILEALLNRHISLLVVKINQVVSQKDINPADKLSIMIQTLFQGFQIPDGVLFQYLYNEKTIHFLDKLSREGKALLSPIFLKILQEGQEQKCFHIEHLSAAISLIISILDSLIEAVYEECPSAQILAQFSLAEKLIEYILGAKPGMIHIS